jgi:hypothetical protein
MSCYTLLAHVQCISRPWFDFACVLQDLPDGNYHELKKNGSKAKGKPHKEFLTALLCVVHPLCLAFFQSKSSATCCQIISVAVLLAVSHHDTVSVGSHSSPNIYTGRASLSLQNHPAICQSHQTSFTGSDSKTLYNDS